MDTMVCLDNSMRTRREEEAAEQEQGVIVGEDWGRLQWEV
jgi:hypothetical protein